MGGIPRSAIPRGVSGGHSHSHHHHHRPETSGKFLCLYMLNVRLSDPFDVAKRVIGPEGHNVKLICHRASGCKVRLRGEGFQNPRDSAPSQLNISVPTAEGYIIAKHLVGQLLERIFKDYFEWTGGRPRVVCQEHSLNEPIDCEYEKMVKSKSAEFRDIAPFITDMRTVRVDKQRRGK